MEQPRCPRELRRPQPQTKEDDQPAWPWQRQQHDANHDNEPAQHSDAYSPDGTSGWPSLDPRPQPRQDSWSGGRALPRHFSHGTRQGRSRGVESPIVRTYHVRHYAQEPARDLTGPGHLRGLLDDRRGRRGVSRLPGRASCRPAELVAGIGLPKWLHPPLAEPAAGLAVRLDQPVVSTSAGTWAATRFPATTEWVDLIQVIGSVSHTSARLQAEVVAVRWTPNRKQHQESSSQPRHALSEQDERLARPEELGSAAEGRHRDDAGGHVSAP